MLDCQDRSPILRADDTVPYDQSFYEGQAAGSLRSAVAVVPLVMEYVRPQRVIDFGCGRGTWLSVFRDLGVEIKGVDGDYVDRASLLIDESCFEACDLARIAPRFGEFDLALCLEVAEHLAPAAGELLVSTLTKTAPVVLFSAAPPGQGGTHHVNEQWPWYWEALFRAQGFSRVDVLRASILPNPSIEWWYRQNLVFYVAPAAMERLPALAAPSDPALERLEVVSERVLRANFGIRGSSQLLLRALGERLHRLIRKREGRAVD